MFPALPSRLRPAPQACPRPVMPMPSRFFSLAASCFLSLNFLMWHLSKVHEIHALVSCEHLMLNFEHLCFLLWCKTCRKLAIKCQQAGRKACYMRRKQKRDLGAWQLTCHASCRCLFLAARLLKKREWHGTVRRQCKTLTSERSNQLLGLSVASGSPKA